MPPRLIFVLALAGFVPAGAARSQTDEKNLTPQPPSRSGKGEPEVSPPFSLREGGTAGLGAFESPSPATPPGPCECLIPPLTCRPRLAPDSVHLRAGHSWTSPLRTTPPPFDLL